MRRCLAALAACAALGGACARSAPAAPPGNPGLDVPAEPAPSGAEAQPAVTPVAQEDPVMAQDPGTRAGGDPGRAAAQGRTFAASIVTERSGGEGNVLLSPHSISEALVMTMAGAVGPTLEAMRTSLRVDANAADPWADAGALAVALRADAEAGGVEFALANRVWIDRPLGDLVVASFRERIARDFGAELGLADFGTDAERARSDINAWVAGQTRERIPELLQPGIVDASTSAVLVNALYFKAQWATPFAPEATHDEAFRTADGTQVSAPMMHRTGTMAYWAQGEQQAVSLPYAGGAFEMRLATAPFGELAAALPVLLGGPLLGDSELQRAEVALTMPRFTLRAQSQLRQTLIALGMGRAFEEADFSAMIEGQATQIDEVVHEVFVEVTEQGTEAAAATAVVMTRAASIPRPPIVMRLDRPFLFAIRHVPTGAVLFVGRVDDPTG